MTNTAKKPAKTSRDNLDLDLDARLDQATSTLPLDEEPIEGDNLDQILAKAKKELDANLALTIPPSEDTIESETSVQSTLNSENIMSIENQLTAAMESAMISDDELDHLLGGVGYDFDSLLGDANDELTIDEAAISYNEQDELTADEVKLNEDSLLATIDELLNFGVEEEEPEVTEESNIISQSELNNTAAVMNMELDELKNTEILNIIEEIDSTKLDIESKIEPEKEEFLEPEIATVATETTVIDPEAEIVIVDDKDVDTTELEKTKHIELIVEPEVALEDIVDSVSFDKIIEEVDADTSEISDNSTIFEEEFNNFDDIADTVVPFVEISLPTDEELNLDEARQLDGLNDAMENKNETIAGFDFLEEEITEKEQTIPVVEVNEEFEFAEKVVTGTVMAEVKADDDMDWMKQLEDLEATEEANSEAVTLEKTVEADAAADDDMDWMKQLEDLEATEEANSEAMTLEKTVEANANADDDMDWMKQLEDLEATEEANSETATLEKTVEADADDDMDWMKQLEDLEATEEANNEAMTLEKTVEADGDMDWMKQLESIDTLDENENEGAVDHKFNIADAESQQTNMSIDEEALIAKAAGIAIEQFRGDQEALVGAFKDDQAHTLSQLRADQDSFETKNRKQFADVQNNNKKAATFGYAALGVGIIGLIGSATLGYYSYNAKSKADTLAESITVLEEKVNLMTTALPEKEKEIANIKTSIEQLNQKVGKLEIAQIPVAPSANISTSSVVEESKTDANKLLVKGAKVDSNKTILNSKVASIVSPVNLLNNKIAPSDLPVTIAEPAVVSPAEIVPSVDIPPAPSTSENKVETKLSDMAKKSTEITKDKASKTAKADAEKAKEKAEALLLTEKIAKATAVAKAASANIKTEEQRKLLAENHTAMPYRGKMTRGMSRGIAKDKNDKVTAKTETKAPENTLKKEVLNLAIKPQKVVPTGKYAVNVVSYQQEWFAQSKAAEFRQKGIPVEVSPADPNDYATKYRLKVAGFKTKADANAYAKAHGLNESWVSN